MSQRDTSIFTKACFTVIIYDEMRENQPKSNIEVPPTSEIGPRFSLLNSIIKREWTEQSNLGTVRYAACAARSGRSDEALLCDQIQSGNLSLGTEKGIDATGRYRVFSVPVSSRLFKHEAAAGSTSSFTDGNEVLFREAGMIMGYLFSDEVGGYHTEDMFEVLALRDFLRPSESPVLLVPGAEKVFKKTEKNPDLVLRSYDAQMRNNFSYYNFVKAVFDTGFYETATR